MMEAMVNTVETDIAEICAASIISASMQAQQMHSIQKIVLNRLY